MKRIVCLVCGLFLLLANTAEARRGRFSGGATYAQPVYAQRVNAQPVNAQRVNAQPVNAEPALAAPAANNAPPAEAATVTQVSYSTSTAQGVANIMAANNRVGHWGGNPGYEGCGCGPTPAAAYNICCYGNSGMATVDVGYARSASGMWYCCRRYR